MRILSVSKIPPGNDAEWWRIHNIYNFLKGKCEIDLVSYIIKGTESAKRVDNGLSSKNTTLDIITPFALPFRHLQNLNVKDYDIVYGNTYASSFLSLPGKIRKLPLVTDMHGIPEEEFILLNGSKYYNPLKFFLIKLMNSSALTFSDKIICVSRKMVSYLNNRHNVPTSKMSCITNGVDLNFFNKASLEKIENLKMKLGFDDKIVFGYIGGFQKWQGVDTFITAAKSLAGQKDIAFLFVGADGKSTDNIKFLPPMDRKSLINYYSVCDVLVLPRPSNIVTEVASPTKFAEYAAMSCPILATDVGDAADFIRKYKNGLLVKSNTPADLRKGILDIIDSETDFKKMSKRSRKLAEEEFNWNKLCEKLFNELKQL